MKSEKTDVGTKNEAPEIDLNQIVEDAQKRQQECAKRLGVEVTVTNSIGLKLCLIPEGKFLMGASGPMRRGYEFDFPQHPVTLTKAYYLGCYEVTQQQFQQIMQFNPSHFAEGGTKSETVKGQDTSHHPVEGVSWYDAVQYCNELSSKEGLPLYYEMIPDKKKVVVRGGTGYRLPTEAEWEYACRAGTTTNRWYGKNRENWREYGVFDGPTTKEVGRSKPNPFGLYEMYGNVSEWCQDYFKLYSPDPVTDPYIENEGGSAVVRGGRIGAGAIGSSIARDRFPPDHTRDNVVGFRVARTVVPIEQE